MDTYNTNRIFENKKKSYFLRKWEKIKKWYRNRRNPNQWIVDMLINKRLEFIKICYMKYNYRTADNLEQLIQQLVHDINHQVECIQFVQTVSQIPQRLSIGSTSSSDSAASDTQLTNTNTNTNTNKMRGIEIDLEILIVEYMALKEHLANCMRYLQDNHIPISATVEIPGTPRGIRPHPESFYIVDTQNVQDM